MASLHEYLASSQEIYPDWLCTGKSVLRVTEVGKNEETHPTTWISQSEDLDGDELQLRLQHLASSSRDLTRGIVLQVV